MPPKKQNMAQAKSTSTGSLLTDMAHDSNIRTTEKSKKLQQDYEDELDDLEARLHDKVADDMQALSAIRQDQLTRLIALIRKRSAIEAAINESHTRLSEAYETASRDLRRAIKIRSDAISDKVAAAAAASEDQEEAKGEDKENEPPLPLPAGERGRGSGQNNGRAAGQDLMEGVEMHGNVVEGFKAPSKKTVERAEGMARKGLRG